MRIHPKISGKTISRKGYLYMSIKISDDYLYGFIEGEGCFYVGIVPSTTNKNRFQVIPFFKVSQNPKGKVILDFLRKRLNCGYIKPNDKKISSDKSLAFVVRDILSLKEKVIPFFEGNLFIKRESFLKFKKIVNLMSKNKHLTNAGFRKVIDIAYSMNTGKRRIPKDELLRHIK